MADTFYGNAANQVCTGNAIRSGATETGLWIITTPIPTVMNKEVMTKGDLITYTNIPTESAPLNALANNECPTVSEISSVF